MTKLDMPKYLCRSPHLYELSVEEEDKTAGHSIGYLNKQMIVWPKKINEETINPHNFIKLKEKFDIDKLLMFDRLIGVNSITAIGNHINHSGQNYLRGKTPTGDLPQFPDMSKIYNKINGYKSIIVHTLGIERFKSAKQDDAAIWSELIGLIAPVAHYVGISVYGLGFNNTKDLINIF